MVTFKGSLDQHQYTVYHGFVLKGKREKNLIIEWFRIHFSNKLFLKNGLEIKIKYYKFSILTWRKLTCVRFAAQRAKIPSSDYYNTRQSAECTFERELKCLLHTTCWLLRHWFTVKSLKSIDFFFFILKKISIIFLGKISQC